ncbi:MAG: phosphate ABC transporter ATP-binding protein [Desulfurococcales archaeon]|nr:phosphate ABC transporter ATP-binding protein [Desulfurococcales archaeon]
MGNAVEIKGLNVRIKGREVLKSINLEVPEGVIYTVMGPSGSGKTTLLRVINRLIDLVPQAEVEGEVSVFGEDVLKADPYLLRRSIGMVFQTPNPFPHLTIYDNVALGPRTNRLARTKKELDDLVEWALRKAMLWDEVKERLNAKPHELSGGQKQRLCLARALAMKPKLLLLDEPTANIDPANTKRIEEALRNLKNDTTIILVTHYVDQATRISDYIAILKEGSIRVSGELREVKNELTKHLA